VRDHCLEGAGDRRQEFLLRCSPERAKDEQITLRQGRRYHWRRTGVGLGSAQEFVNHGASVVVMGRRQATLDKAVALLGPKTRLQRPRALANLDDLYSDATTRRLVYLNKLKYDCTTCPDHVFRKSGLFVP